MSGFCIRLTVSAQPSDLIWPQALKGLSRRLSVLRDKPFAELAALPTHHSESVDIDGASITYVVYRVTEPDGGVKIVVQARRELNTFLFFQFDHTFAEGFRVRDTGGAVAIPEQELYADYI